MSAELAHPEMTPQRLDWLADDAVGFEPVSRPNSLLTGKRTGNFVETGLQWDFDDTIRAWSEANSSPNGDRAKEHPLWGHAVDSWLRRFLRDWRRNCAPLRARARGQARRGEVRSSREGPVRAAGLVRAVRRRVQRACRSRCEASRNRSAWSEAPRHRSPAPYAWSLHRHRP
jgi:hypothetical protein